MDNKLKIINYLGKHIGESFTMNGLSKAIQIPYATFYRTILEMNELVETKIVGKAKIITLNRNNPAIKSYLSISSEEEKKEFLKKQPIINKISSELDTKDSVILFGSYAKGTATQHSDIDILVVNNKGDKSISLSKYETLFKKRIDIIFVTRKEFITMLNEQDENVGKQALKNHIILQNPENFWECVLNG